MPRGVGYRSSILMITVAAAVCAAVLVLPLAAVPGHLPRVQASALSSLQDFSAGTSPQERPLGQYAAVPSLGQKPAHHYLRMHALVRPKRVSVLAAPVGSPQQIAAAMLGSYGWGQDQFGCLVNLWNAESGWNYQAENPSGAFGIPQALPGSKMASAGADWQTDPATQIRWGLGYVKSVYGSPCGAWAHEQADGYY